MTKEELARKKGIKTKETTQTAAEALLTTREDVKIEEKETEDKKVEQTKKTTKAKPKVIKEPKKNNSSEQENGMEVPPAEKSKKTDSIQVEKKEAPKVGRPKGKPSTKFSFNIPDEYIAPIKIGAALHCNGNTSAYLVSLIQKDLEENKKLYDTLMKSYHKE